MRRYPHRRTRAGGSACPAANQAWWRRRIARGVRGRLDMCRFDLRKEQRSQGGSLCRCRCGVCAAAGCFSLYSHRRPEQSNGSRILGSDSMVDQCCRSGGSAQSAGGPPVCVCCGRSLDDQAFGIAVHLGTASEQRRSVTPRSSNVVSTGPGTRAALAGAGRLCCFCVDLGPHRRRMRHGTPSLPALMQVRGLTTWLPRKDSNFQPAG
jgi:hypothetical protein